MKTMWIAVIESDGDLNNFTVHDGEPSGDDEVVWAGREWFCWKKDWHGKQNIGWYSVGTREEFEKLAHQIYGGQPPYLPEINEECEYSLGGPYYPCTICYRYTDYRGEHFIIECPHIDNDKQHVSVESEKQPVFFRPKKSDQELWVKAAEKVNKAHFWTQTEFLVALYDAMQSGELPVPEVK